MEMEIYLGLFHIQWCVLDGQGVMYLFFNEDINTIE